MSGSNSDDTEADSRDAEHTEIPIPLAIILILALFVLLFTMMVAYLLVITEMGDYIAI